MAIRIERRGRHWAVYDAESLVCITVYKKGALEVRRRLELLEPASDEMDASHPEVTPSAEGGAAWTSPKRTRSGRSSRVSLDLPRPSDTPPVHSSTPLA
jgi:hypothetical protein